MITEERIEQIRYEVEAQLSRPRQRQAQTKNLTDYQRTQIMTTPLTETDEPDFSTNVQALFDTQTHSEEDILPNQNSNNDANKIQEDLAQKIKDQFVSTTEKFINTDPISRPFIPKQKTSKKLAMIVEYIDSKILPDYLNNEQNFHTLHTIIYIAAYTAATCNGAKINIDRQSCNSYRKTKPSWRKRLENKIQTLRTEIAHLTQYSNGNRSYKVVDSIEQIKSKYRTHAQYENPNTELSHFLDTLKQKLNIVSNRLKRNISTLSQERHNTRAEAPTPETLKEFWSQIWEQPAEHKENAEWIDEVSRTVENAPEMRFEHIPVETFKNILKRMHNWKAPGSDNLHAYWYKKFTRTHPHIHNHLNTFIQSPDTMPTFITQGITYMLPKDNHDTQNPAKYRPITCLQIFYKILTGCISELIYQHVAEHNILSEQQKGCRKFSQGCKEQLTLDAIVLNHAYKKKKDIHSMFIDYRKAFDSIPHTWLLKVLQIYKINPIIISFLQVSMQNWQTKLKINQSLTTEPIHIKRGIFQGDALSPLWFCLALNPLSDLINHSKLGFKLNNEQSSTISHLMYMDDIKLFASNASDLFNLADITQQFSTDINMQFGVDKCKILSIKKGKLVHNSYALNTGETIEPMNEVSTYKYLGFNQSRQIQQKQTKTDLTTKFKHRLNLILKSELNSRNIVKAINTFAIPVLTYSFGIINWSQTDLQKLQRTIHTKLTKFRKHHPKSCIQRLTLPRQEGGRGLIDIHNLHNKQITTLRQYFHTKSEHSALHRHASEKDTKLTPLNLHDRQPQTKINRTNG
ncbi:unnamed protein product [Euphydryas editha]|uniref:Reverse transcriptase domain-containing protein n=1 Tax=Euphydryas editha TaxID=104508 RepID=A0AAU9V4Y3_EUPED|nr:unnamed protein product [Euphydryas editha]